ncbi:MAG: acireductone dioxygenase [Myxococcales bacterium]|nr:acireductone dioxygenase [Myxococcales bacterium]
MAVVNIKDEGRTLHENQEIIAFLEPFGIWYRRFEGSDQLPEDANEEQILEAYREPIEELKRKGGYVTADVINVKPTTPGIEAMLAKFSREHWHDEDEVRFIVHGSGVFHVHPKEGPVFSIEMFKGDMINVPKGTLHWFDLCKERTIRAIRLFLDPAGWTPHYTESGIDQGYQPLCFGPSYLPQSSVL